MGQLITAREAAARVGISRSQLNRDATEGKLDIAQQYPGYNGPRMFDSDVVEAYAKTRQDKAA